MTYVLPGWTGPEPKCPGCHQSREHEKGCPYEDFPDMAGLAAIVALAEQSDDPSRSGDEDGR
ncbi:hypothetical protein [Micromonospora sp. NPDC126480]|uniref:hypothetical protein n=1 Tax=Micromonospora sp. NPDC126480 TaxID=3155312 RepID=UPI0033286583